MLDWTLFVFALLIFLVTLPGTIELALISIGGLWGRRRRELPSEASQCRVAAIIPVHNEEASLARTIRSLLACDAAPPAADIVVMASNTTDRSVAIAREFGCTVLERVEPSRRGKGYGLNYAFRELAGAGYDAFVIIDADTVVDRNVFTEFRRVFASGADAGQVVVRVGNPEANLRTHLINIAFLAFTHLRPLARHNLGLSAGIFNGFGVSAKTVEEVPYECFSITEDLEYHLELIRAGKTVRFLPDCSIHSDMCVTARDATPQRARWEGGRFRLLAEKAPQLALEMVRERDIRRLEPLLDLLLLPLAYQSVILVLLAVVASGPLRVYAVSGLGLIVFHIVQAMILGGAKAGDWKALCAVPFYIGWKILNLGRILGAANKSAAWRRTQRSQV